MGSFDWSYPVPMPPSGFGAAPSVGFTYSSSAVDGVVLDENNQGLLGAGWSLASGGFIERTYLPCTLDGGGSSKDLCWVSDNATISLNGRSSELVKVETTGSLTKWRLKDDPGWFIEREQGVAVSASDNRGERWTVWSPDGTKYVFGLRAQTTGGEATNSVWTVPVRAQAGEPCAGSWCQQAWRWNLDRVQDPSGNIITYMYEAENNFYGVGGEPNSQTSYQRGGYLREIRYGAHLSAPTVYRNRVMFNMKERCQQTTSLGTPCLWSGTATAVYPDVPTDLQCTTAASCDKYSPSFFTKMGLESIDTQVLETDVAAGNGDVDTGAGWAKIDPVGGFTNILPYSVASLAQSGAGFLEANSTPGGGSVYSDYTVGSLPAGSGATLTAWVRSPGVAVSGTMKLWELWGAQSGVQQDFVADGTWRQISVTVPSVAAANTILRAEFYINTPGHNLDIDSVSVRAAAAWRTVDRVQPEFEWPLPQAGNPPQLWLRRIVRTGSPGTAAAVVMPEVEFHSRHSVLDNRADSMEIRMYRVDEITDELGGRTVITYGQRFTPTATTPDPVTSTTPSAPCVMPTAGWVYNTQDCYPRYAVIGTDANDNPISGFVAFNRFLVKSVTVKDTVAGGPDIVHTYSYEGGQAYHHNDSVFTPATFRTWSEPRGFGEVIEQVGSGAVITQTKHRFFRGMNGDKGPASQPVRYFNVVYGDGTVVPDHPPLRGREFETVLNPAAPIDRTAHYYATVSPFAGVQRVDEVMTRHWREGTTSIYTETATVFDAEGFPTQVHDKGDVTTAADDTCTAIWYARGPSAPYMKDRVARVYTAKGAPTGTWTWGGLCSIAAGAEINIADTGYDNTTGWAQIGTKGLPTRTWTRSNVSATQWDPFTAYTYDSAGRLTSVDGVLPGTGDTTFTTYDWYGFAKSVTGPTGQIVETLSDPGRGAAMWVKDRNVDKTDTADGADDDRRTGYRYDGAGRTVEVYTADGGRAAAWYTYTLSADKSAPAKVQTTIEQGPGVAVSSWTYLDGLGRTRETQSGAPNGGRLVTATQFDDRGLVASSGSGLHDGVPAGQEMLSDVAMFPSWLFPSETVNGYDHAGRMVSSSLRSYGSQVSVNGVAVTTIQSYAYLTAGTWSTIIDPPDSDVTQTATNVRGQTMWAKAFTTPSTFSQMSYGYDVAGRQVSSTDSQGNTRSVVYDLLGRQTSTIDPDGGTTLFTYRADGALLTSEPVLAAGVPSEKLVYNPDVLGRVLDVRQGSETGTVLESYVYDTLGAGLVSSVSSFTDGAEFKIGVKGYDLRGRPTGYAYTVPSIVGVTDNTANPLAGVYSFNNFEYDRGDHLESYDSPEAGLLPAEKVSTTFNTLGAPVGLNGSGVGALVNSTTFTNEGRISGRVLENGATDIVRGYLWSQATGQLNEMSVTSGGSVLQRDRMIYDAAGRLKGTRHDRAGAGEDHDECFSYDGGGRLVEAFTAMLSGGVSGDPQCSVTPNPGTSGYQETFDLDDIGNLTVGPNGVYNYPTSGAGSVRPHAPEAAGTTTVGVGHARPLVVINQPNNRHHHRWWWWWWWVAGVCVEDVSVVGVYGVECEFAVGDVDCVDGRGSC